MATEAGAPPVMAEIAQLLEQCTPEELSNILETIDRNPPAESGESTAAMAPLAEPAATASPAVPTEASFEAKAEEQLAPVPPPGPPPAGGSRRPNPRTAKRTEGEAASGASEPADPAAIATESGPSGISKEELRRLLDEHSAGVLSEVRKLLPAAGTGGGTDSVDMAVFTQALVDRDREVRQLEARLADLQADLAVKDRRVGDLGAQLDQTVREVRHRQLDLEFQQLKLEERVRNNTELEQLQRTLTQRAEEASLNVRHAALDIDIGRTITTPRSVRVQGSLPWTLRKNRLPAVDAPALAPGAAQP